jgi:uncharacterized protein YndB with AHSA1/START domain
MLTATERTTQDLTFECTINVSASEVFRAFIAPGALKGWLCNAALVEPQRAGRIYLGWNDGYYTPGEFTEYRPYEALAFTWNGRGDPSPTEVRVELHEENSTTTLRLTHSGIGTDPEWAEQAHITSGAWDDYLENLQSYLETGIDLRVARRPMFGISDAEDLNPDIAKKLNAPVNEGLHLRGFVDGMGAQAAGLTRGDVVTALGGKPVTGFVSLGEALQGRKAGDRVPVSFYRDGQEQTVTVELSKRAMPEVPASPQELASNMRETIAQLDAELDDLLAGVTEDIADYRPSPDDWTIKEIVAHILAAEQDAHAWVAAMEEDFDREDIFHSNTPARIKGLTAAYRTLPAIVEALKQGERVTIAMAGDLPAKIAARKGDYYQLAIWWSDFAQHHREHFAEIRNLIESARAK